MAKMGEEVGGGRSRSLLCKHYPALAREERGKNHERGEGKKKGRTRGSKLVWQTCNHK